MLRVSGEYPYWICPVCGTQPDAGTTRYKYDSRHNVRFSQNAQQAAGGKVSYFTYDLFSRMTRSGEVARAFASLDANRAYAFETGAASWTSRYIYDIDDAGESGAAESWPVGRPVRIEQNTDADAAAEVTARIAYDHEGRVTHRRVAIEGLPEKDVFYSYDLAGKVTAMVYPDGGEVHYAYDAAGRLSAVRDAEGSALAAYGYDGDGRMTTHNVGHAVGGALATGAYAYNVRDWVSRIDYPGRFTLSQAYDAVGNVTSQNYRRAATEALKTASYTYDGLHRLKTVSLGATHARSYGYDANGNVTHVATGGDTATYAYSRGSTPNRLDSITQRSTTDRFTYNANGSATQVAGTAMAYDHRGLLTGYGAHAYTLDAEGYRVKKTGGGSTVYYIRGAGGSVLATYDAAGNLTAAYVYAAGERLAKVANGVVSYYLKDHLGSTRTLLSSEGTAEATYDYWPYGEVLASSGTDSAPFKFTGHERDEESGLDFMQYRTYGSERLRFLQVDPAAEKYPGLSPYAYAANNPLTFTDARGDTLDVGGIDDGRTALSYLHSMVDEETAKRITMGDGGRVSFNTEGLDLSQDSGLELLDNMINGPGMFLFEVGKVTSARYRDSGKSFDLSVSDHPLGIRLFSVTPSNIGTDNPGSGPLPMSGYDGQLALAPGYWTLKGGAPEVPHGDVTFHELSELYHRTIGGMPYIRSDGSGAHDQALKDAKRYKNQVVLPSKLRKGVTFWPEP